ncbi:hypothetical protein BGZ82_004162, partial [Podila clonocystis]
MDSKCGHHRILGGNQHLTASPWLYLQYRLDLFRFNKLAGNIDSHIHPSRFCVDSAPSILQNCYKILAAHDPDIGI